MDFNKHKGQVGGALTGTVLSVIIVAILLVVGAVIFGQLDTINTSSLGANANATTMIVRVFDLLFTTQGVIVLVIVVALLGLVIFTVLNSISGGKGR